MCVRARPFIVVHSKQHKYRDVASFSPILAQTPIRPHAHPTHPPQTLMIASEDDIDPILAELKVSKTLHKLRLRKEFKKVCRAATGADGEWIRSYPPRPPTITIIPYI